MYSQYNTNSIYDNNHIVVNNNEPTGHDDCIQSFQDNNLTIHSNYLNRIIISLPMHRAYMQLPLLVEYSGTIIMS